MSAKISFGRILLRDWPSTGLVVFAAMCLSLIVGSAIYGTPVVANGAVYLQSNTHLFAFTDPTKQSGVKDEPQKLDIQLKK